MYIFTTFDINDECQMKIDRALASMIVIRMEEISTETVSILLLSLERLCRNLSDLLTDLDADVEFCEYLLDQIFSPIEEISSSTTTTTDTEDDVDDFYERIVDEQLEPKLIRVTDL